MNPFHHLHGNYVEHSLRQWRRMARAPLNSSDGSRRCLEVTMNLSRTNLIAPRPALRLGFVPLTDCAPLVMAHELGLFRKYGVRVAAQPRTRLGDDPRQDHLRRTRCRPRGRRHARRRHARFEIGALRLPDRAGAEPAWQRDHLVPRSLARGVRDGATLREEIRRVAAQTAVHLRRSLFRSPPTIICCATGWRRPASIRTATCASSSCRRRRWFRTSKPAIWTASAWANPGIRWPCNPARAGARPSAPNSIRAIRKKF